MASIKGMPDDNLSERDYTGADLVDFLDGYFCTGNNDSDGKLKGRSWTRCCSTTISGRSRRRTFVCMRSRMRCLRRAAVATPVAASTNMAHAAAVATFSPEGEAQPCLDDCAIAKMAQGAAEDDPLRPPLDHSHPFGRPPLSWPAENSPDRFAYGGSHGQRFRGSPFGGFAGPWGQDAWRCWSTRAEMYRRLPYRRALDEPPPGRWDASLRARRGKDHPACTSGAGW